ncbi:MAG: hypothetical protein HYU52_16180 [Acidobacteria bacterium]|nr:hypothetical protein [Acidobacteriota bacterium]
MDRSHRQEIAAWFRVAGIVFVVVALASFFARFFGAQFHRATGEAQWIWPDTQLSAGAPLAFFAVKELEVPLNPPFVRIKIACDPEYTLYFNGEVVGRALEGSRSTLDVYDVTALARQGEKNRIVVAARSANGVGGLIAAVDYAPMRENDIVTDASWTLVGAWRDDLPLRDSGLPTLPVRVLGAPPFGRWNDLALANRERTTFPTRRVAPVESRSVSLAVSRIRVVGGVAVASRESEAATAWDFGEFEGNCLLNDAGGATASTRIVRLRAEPNFRDFGFDGTTREIALAPGETSYLDPRQLRARWVAVYGSAAAPVVIPREGPPEERMPDE